MQQRNLSGVHHAGLRRLTRCAIAALAAGAMFLSVVGPARAVDCTPRAQQEIEKINQRAAAASNTNDTGELCRGLADQIKSYEFLIGLFNNPECHASDPKAGIAQMNAKVGPLREAHTKYCNR
jgi:hypothetical protein